MYIKSIEISNYRSIGNSPPIILDIGDITVLSGTNDTGKTSALVASYIGLNNVTNASNQNEIYKLRLVDGSKH
jgi:AAA15 family ATPase/GTPase